MFRVFLCDTLPIFLTLSIIVSLQVRRVKKSASSAASLSGKESPSKDITKDTKNDDKGSSLSGFLGTNESAKPKKSGSATVSGDGRSSSKDGEVFRRADGKLVRRVKRSVSSSASAAGTMSTKSSSKESAGLGSFLSNSPADPKSRMSGSATVTGATSTSKSEQSEVYINKDGKKVRRVKRSVSSSAQKTSSGALSGFMDKQSTSLGPKKLSGSASVSGSTPSTQQGEVYINKDGKKVRRVKRAASAAASLAPGPRSSEKLGRSDGGSILSPNNNQQTTKPVAASATVAGDRVLKSDADGEIVIRADGKKVIRRRKGASSAASTAGSQQDGEVYRRADGKLVRRVRKTVTNAGVRGGAAGDLANFMDKTASDKSAKRGGGAATVAGDMPSLSRKAKQAQLTSEEEPEKTGPISQLSPEDEKAAEAYRKMLKMGLPDDAVKHKMIQDAVGPEIIQSVLNREVPAKNSGGNSSAGASGGNTAIQLSTDEEAIAGRFRKMLKMGLPEDAVRQKMSVEGIDQRIMAAVLGDDVPQESAAQSPPSSALASSLSSDQEAIAGRFRKMLKMGLPEDAVRHKMLAEGIDQTIISAVVGGPEPVAAPPTPVVANSLSDEEESTAARFRKMLKMGLPEDAVKHKMMAEGVDEKIISAVVGVGSGEPAASPPSSAPAGISLSADEEAVAARFRKMLKMGLPNDAVKHKMVAEGVSDKIMDAVLGVGEPASSTPAPASAQSTQESPPTTSLSAEEEESAERFRKMLKMGLPEDAVKHKMVQENVGSRIIAAVLGGTVPASQTQSSPAATAATSSLSDEDAASVEKYKKMVKMGMPEDAVKHKMTADGANPNVMSAVFGGGSPPAANGSAFIVVVNDDHKSIPVATAEDIKANPDDKFSVTVGDGSGDASKGNTKLMSLDDIAKATGQNKEELERLVKESQAKGQPPKFVLNPVGGSAGTEPGKEGMYEVQVPTAPIPEGAKVMDPKKNYAELSAGKEVVDSKLADAARAVSALGDLDMKNLLAKLQAGDMEVLMNKLREAEKRQKKLEKQLAQSGIAIAEDIDYGEAKQKVEEIAKRMGEIGGSDVTVADKEEQNKLREEYFKLEQQMERYNTALMLTEEYQAEQDRLEQKWEDDNAPGNLEALKKIRRHMPVKIRHMSEADLTNNPSPNGKFLPKAIAKKFKRTNVLQCLRINPDDLERMHPSTLENMRVTGLTLTERRALYYHLRPLGPKWEKNKAEKMTERKWTWYQMMKSNFKENLAPYQRHVDQYGPPENHQGCTLIGKQCPIKADKIIDYDGDYGWTDAAEFEVSDVKKADADDPGAKAMQEALELARAKKANERADLLKKHYKGKLLQVSKANGSCESMDEAMDRMENHTMKWIEFIIDKGDKIVEADKKKEVANFTDAINELKLSSLDFAQRSGMQLSGKKKAGGDGEDIRSSVEAGLADEVWETSGEFFKFIRKRMKENETKDTRVEKTMELIENMLGELHDKNTVLLKKLGVQRPERSRKLKKSEELKKEVEERRKPEEDEVPAEDAAGGGPPGPPRGGGGRGGLLGKEFVLWTLQCLIQYLTVSSLYACKDAIAGARGRGPPGRGGGRGGLLDAIAGARGRGRGGGDKGGRGGLLGTFF